ncbi:MAG: RluA family pseudouridine synthase [Bacteriovoracaceae bacterium]
MKIYKTIVNKHFTTKTSALEVLVKISKQKEDLLIDAALKGAVWLQEKSKGKILRLRDLSVILDPSDTISFFYDHRVLAIETLEEGSCLFENSHYGIWFKPAGIITQGTQAGDHSSLMRYIEKTKNRQIYLVHRLDRETAGLILFSYHQESAKYFSKLFSENKVKKVYHAIVMGQTPESGKINFSLEDKEALTFYKRLEASHEHSLVEVEIKTGRLHQIRKHFDMIGHPVLGDPKYGKGNKNKDGLKLLAYGLEFRDPFDRQKKTFQSPFQLSLKSIT